MSDATRVQATAGTELRRFWPAVVACFAIAVFSWGFGFSGASVYLAELQRIHGWPSALIASAITAYYLVGGLCLTRVHATLEWLGPRRLLAISAMLLGVGTTLFSRSRQSWELFVAVIPMALGWAGSTSTAISTTLALYFQQQRGLAITLALNGASVAGFTIGPLLVELSHRIGVENAVPVVVIGALAIVLPLIGFGVRTPEAVDQYGQHAVAKTDDPGLCAKHNLRTWRFWSIALPFALALAAQVGLIVHLVSFLLPRLGAAGAATALSLTSPAAVGGRLALAGVIDRPHQRRGAAVSFASQAAGLALMIGSPGEPGALYAGCILFGLSVGNVITFPALIVQREFPGAAFGVVIGLSTAIGQFTFALAPWLLGIVRDETGDYIAVLGLCIALQLGAAVLRRGQPRQSRLSSDLRKVVVQISALRNCSLLPPCRARCAQELVFADERAARLDQDHQYIEGTAAKLDGDPIGAELAAVRQQPEPAELDSPHCFVGRGRFSV